MANQKQALEICISPDQRTFSKWCEDLGIECLGQCPEPSLIMTYAEFCFLPDIKLLKVKKTDLYGFWRNCVDVSQSGECRTIGEWLNDMNLEIVDPTEEELNDLNLFIGWDEFMSWSSGIVTDKVEDSKISFFKIFSGLFRR